MTRKSDAAHLHSFFLFEEIWSHDSSLIRGWTLDWVNFKAKLPKWRRRWSMRRITVDSKYNRRYKRRKKFVDSKQANCQRTCQWFWWKTCNLFIASWATDVFTRISEKLGLKHNVRTFVLSWFPFDLLFAFHHVLILSRIEIIQTQLFLTESVNSVFDKKQSICDSETWKAWNHWREY